MPQYTYQCPACNLSFDRTCTIAEMLEFEAKETLCSCAAGNFERVYLPRCHITFRAGIYENASDDPVYIDRPQQLVDLCRANNNTSHYMADMAGLFGAKQNRWV